MAKLWIRLDSSRVTDTHILIEKVLINQSPYARIDCSI